MKIRNGFVSNSSSSSFIIGIANASKAGRDDIGIEFDPDKKEFNSWGNVYLVDVGMEYPYARLTELADDTYKLTISSFDDTEVSCIAKPGDKIVALYGWGPDGDEAFSVYDDDGEWLDMDYGRIDIDDFSDKDQEKAELIQSLGGDYTYGAGRNG